MPAIQQLLIAYGKATGPVAIVEWLCNEGTGTTLNDSSGNGFTAHTGGLPWQNSGPSPPAGSTWYLANDGTYSAYSNENIIYGTNIITLDFWAYSTDWTNGGSGNFYLFESDGTSIGSFNIWTNGSGTLLLYVADVNGHQRSCSVGSGSVPNNTWLHFQIVLNNTNGTIQVYINSGGNAAGSMSGTFAGATNIASQILYFNEQSLVNMTDIKIFKGDTHTL